MQHGPKVYFIGAGPGAPDLITVRGRDVLGQAHVVIYADSLVHPDICRWARPDAQIYGSSSMTLEEMTGLMVSAVGSGKTVARLHSGDPSIYGALHEQLAVLEGLGIPYEIVPGVSSAFAAAAALKTELTIPQVSQTVIFTRFSGRTGGVREEEHLRRLAAHGATMVIFLSVGAIQKVVKALIQGGYPPETPVRVVYRATWEEERVISGTLDNIAAAVREAGIKRQALILVGRVLDPALRSQEEALRSRLYHPSFFHSFRPKPRPGPHHGPTKGGS